MADEEPGDSPTETTGNAVDNTVKDPEDWKTGGEPITGAQESYLSTLAEGAGKDIDTSDMSKAEASEAIDDLQDQQGS